ncbi:LPS export ABC transporter periplasmic protein LptC [Caulobacter hibisci]|uniref:LPS export ABC transporter periplasmic protein LptC n=1 Tax=Caulobacter hibisci TaxID=2035993 RepID=A0ABS0SY64_9CAUL|nr:LPS export ABC transporter periplasmic protein LptC [Caulobacter hibisci]MBI1683835.1 LPS export ABC transporter periplasmic protein LptC [Caulobacter hibisci]
MTTAALSTAAKKPRRNRRRPSARWTRAGLLVFAVGVGVAVVGQTAYRMIDARNAVKAATAAPLAMDNPRFTGAMRDGRAFLITARRAERDPADPNKVKLVDPTLVRGYGAPEASRVTSKSGVYQEAQNLLVLTQDVKIDNGQGYQFASQEARIDTKTGEALGPMAVAGTGPQGNVRADSYSVSDKGDRVVFKGRVRTRVQTQ